MPNTQAQDMRSHATAALRDALESAGHVDAWITTARELIKGPDLFASQLSDARSVLKSAAVCLGNVKQSAAAAQARLDSADDLDGRALFSPRAVYGRTLYDPRNAAAQGLTNLAGARTLTAQQLDALSLAGVLVAIYGEIRTPSADLPRHVPTVPTPPGPS
jgi:hypothetical protein